MSNDNLFCLDIVKIVGNRVGMDVGRSKVGVDVGVLFEKTASVAKIIEIHIFWENHIDYMD